MSQAKQDELLHNSKAPSHLPASANDAQRKSAKSTQKNIKNTLRKFDAAGRIIEIREGKDVIVPYSTYTREKAPKRYIVFRNRDNKAYAYYKRHGRSSCTTSIKPTPKPKTPPTLNFSASSLRVTVIAIQLQEMATIMEKIKVDLDQKKHIEDKLEELQAYILTLEEQIEDREKEE